MRNLKATMAIGVVLLLTAACGGSGPATEGPDGGNTPGPQATIDPGPGATSGGPPIGGGSGSAHVEVSGSVQGGGDYAFFAFGSRFAGDVAGVQLNFTTEGSDGLFQVGGVNDQWIISYTTEAFVLSGVECTRTEWNIGATSASGRFDCPNVIGTDVGTGTLLSGVTMKGNFTASQ